MVVDGFEIELRRSRETAIAPGVVDQSNLGDRVAAIGPWQGETTEELIKLLREEGTEICRGLPDLL
jgi:hypothetical protein